jgi:chaperonin GroES
MKIKKLKPVGIQVIIIPDVALTEVDGLMIPETSRQEPLSGRVHAVGNGRQDYKMTVAVGDEVKYPRFGWTKSTVEIDGKETDVIVIREDECLFAISEEDEPDTTGSPAILVDANG